MTKPYVASRYLSLFSWGRPPIPWDTADVIHVTLAAHRVESVGVTGSTHPSILTAVAYGAPERKVNVFASRGMWDEGSGWESVIDDSPGMEQEVPWPKPYLPFEQQTRFWEGASPFFRSEALFIDMPFDCDCLHLEMHALAHYENKLILLGFLEKHLGPDDVLAFLRTRAYAMTEHVANIHYVEKDEQLRYRLVVAEKSA